MDRTKFTDEEFDKPATIGKMLEFTEAVLIPRFSEVMDEKIQASEQRMEKRLDEKFGRLNYDLKEYIDKKLENQTAEIFQRIDRKFAQEQKFHAKVVEIFKKHKMVDASEISFLESLVGNP